MGSPRETPGAAQTPEARRIPQIPQAPEASEAPKTLEALRATGVTIRNAGPDDAVGGVPPRWVALPESTAEVAALMRACTAHDLAVVCAGEGTRLDRGAPPQRCDLLLDTCCLLLGDGSGVEHSFGDLVARTGAGLSLDALAAVLARAGQELALDGVRRDGVVGGTVGGTLATGDAGPRRFRHGTPRDLLIGVTVVLADGTVAVSGGNVVKNVAGYDLGKLFTGSYGTLGVITEAVFRLHPLPADRRWAGVAPPAAALPALVAELASSQAEPSAIELDWPDAGDDAGGGPTVCVLLEGVAAGGRAEAVRASMDAYGTAWVSSHAPAWWAEPPGEEVLVELRVPPAAAYPALHALAARGLPVGVRGSVASAVLQAALPPETGEAEFAGFVTGVREDLGRLGGGLTVLAAPPELARGVDPWGPSGALGLMRRVKERFDPGRRMSPGRFVGGI